jgi:hypothetical protein
MPTGAEGFGIPRSSEQHVRGLLEQNNLGDVIVIDDPQSSEILLLRRLPAPSGTMELEELLKQNGVTYHPVPRNR